MGGDDRLSRREAQIARLYADGRNYKEIAERLRIAPGTVRTHLNTIFRKPGIQSKLELARLIAKERVLGLQVSQFEGRRSDRHFEGEMQADPHIAKLLEQLGLEQHVEAFTANAIDLKVLMTLSDSDLRELGIQAIGHRKRLAAAIQDLRSQETGAGSAAVPVPEPAARPPPSLAQAERRHLTVMFVDLVGSTALSTRLDPEPMRDLLEHYQRSVAGEVERFGGYVANVMGDGVLVYFGWPEAHEEDAERAVWASLAVTASVSAIGRPDGVPLAVRIGITSGLVVIGQGVGPGAAVVGDPPNLASRLQDLAKPDQIVVSATTAALVGGAFDLGSLGRHPIKGFDQPVEVFEVRGPQAYTGRFEARVGGRPAAMVGRALELGLLEERWRRAVGGEGQVVLLTGEAGFGKSRILRALRDSANVTPASRATVHCSPYQSETALFPFAEQLARSLTSRGADGTKAAKRAQLRDLLTDAGCTSTRAFYALVRLLSIALDDDPSALDAREERQVTLEALAELVLGAPHERPRLILIEDLHWIDPTSRELVDRLVGLAQTLPVLLVMTARPEFAPSWPHGSHVTVLNLHRLDPDHAALLVDRVAEPRKLKKGARDQIVARADGVPLFLEELTKSVLDADGSGAEAGSDWLADQPAITIPATLHDVLMARLDRIPAAKAVAQTAAVLGRQFEHRLLAAAMPWPPERLEPGLDQLVRAGLILRRGRPPEASYLFKHTLIRDEAYQSLLMRDRRVIHGRVLRALEQAGYGSGDAATAPISAKEFSVLAWHATAAELWLEAARYRHLAGSAARSLWAIDEAIGQLRQSLQAFDRATAGDPASGHERRDAVMSTKLALCECLYFMGRFRESFDLLHAAEGELAAIEDAHLRGRSRYWLARLMSRIGWRGPIERLAELAIADSLSCDDRATTANAYNVLCVQRFFAGLPDESVAAGRRAISLLKREGPCETLGFAYHYISIAHVLAGRFDRALEAVESVLRIAETIDHPRLRCYGRGIGGWSLGLSGACAEGLRSLEEASALAPDGATRIFTTGYTGCVQLEAGALEEGAECLREAHEACLAFPSPQYASLFGASLADALRQLHRWSDAEAVARKALGLGRDAPFPFGTGLATRALARLAWARSDRAAAIDLLHQAAEVLSSAGATFELARTYSDLASVTAEVDGSGITAGSSYAEQAAGLLRRLGFTAGRPRAGVRLPAP